MASLQHYYGKTSVCWWWQILTGNMQLISGEINLVFKNCIYVIIKFCIVNFWLKIRKPIPLYCMVYYPGALSNRIYI